MQNEHNFYLKLASIIAEQSYCIKNRVGAILVKDLNIISFGYNGTPKGFDNCCEITIEEELSTKVEVLHAEANAITKCAKSQHSSEGTTLYVTMAPCVECAKLIIQSGIAKVYFADFYRDNAGLGLLEEAGIQTHFFNKFSK